MKRLPFIVVALALLAGLAWAISPGKAVRRPGDARSIEALKSLPYAAWTTVAKADRLKNGVTHYDAERAWQGVNLYSSESEPGAFLIDMQGNVLLELRDPRPEPQSWKLIKPSGPQTFLALAYDSSILSIDAESRILAKRKATFHHDFDLSDDDLLYVIDRRMRKVAALSRFKPVRDDHLVGLDSEGRMVLDISSLDLLLDVPELLALAAEQPRPPLDLDVDVFHTNTISRIRRDVVHDARAIFERGDLLICWRNLNTVAVVDPDGAGTGEPAIRWYWGDGDIERPHNPTLLANGNLLIFDNGDLRGWSRVIELDPVSREIVWEYHGDPPESFFSSSRGSAQRLPNGNTLITDSMPGRVFEITPEGRIVWEFFEPRTRRSWFRTERATIYRMTRLAEWPLPAASARR